MNLNRTYILIQSVWVLKEAWIFKGRPALTRAIF